MVQSSFVKTLLLWDIDGTLISSLGAGHAALCDAVKAVLGFDTHLEGIELAGRTDRWIFRQILAAFQVPHTPETVAALEEAYLAALPARLRERRIYLLPGVFERLQEASRHPSIIQGLLTGNLVRGAKIKLAGHGVWDWLPFGAFADDSENRNDLVPLGMERASLRCGHPLNPARVWIIGDTPLDVACGKHSGVRTLAVATGKYSLETLAATSPCVLLPDLSDGDAFWRAILPADASARR